MIICRDSSAREGKLGDIYQRRSGQMLFFSAEIIFNIFCLQCKKKGKRGCGASRSRPQSAEQHSSEHNSSLPVCSLYLFMLPINVSKGKKWRG